MQKSVHFYFQPTVPVFITSFMKIIELLTDIKKRNKKISNFIRSTNIKSVVNQ